MPTRPAQGSLRPSTQLRETESHQEMEGEPRNGSQVMGTTAELLLGLIPACCVLSCSVIPVLFDPIDYHQAPLSMACPRQEYWSGLPFPSPGDLPDPGIEPRPPALAGRFFTTEPPAKPIPFLFPCNKEPFSSQLNSTGPLLFAQNKTVLVK